ncbi:MAG TPA: hypothetical protein PKA13_09585 [Geminicoccaceae bacterium]|nr:hypothetical protein [Geminicoccus sp.]HMU50017.1 hypothetical protein [Geminicoccaceae bacterium]
MPFPAVVDLDDIAAGRGGFKIQGENAGDGAGSSVSAVGDVDGDGIDDLIVGARGQDSGGADAGAAYVVFGRIGDVETPVDLDAVAAGTGGFKVLGENAGDVAGLVSAAGDVNGDGVDDLIVGATLNGAGGLFAGAAYAVFGRASGSASPVDLADVAAGSGGFKIQGHAYDFVGSSVTAAGDVNGDGIDDLVVGVVPRSRSEYEPPAGSAYVVFGRASGFASPVDLAAIVDDGGGFGMWGERYSGAGSSVSAAGDVNGDGIDDLIVGAYSDPGGGHEAGAAYVVFGRNGGFDSVVNLREVAAGGGGFKIQGENAGDHAGISVSGAGDINGDGIDDVVIGASYNGGFSGAGAAYVVFGRARGLTSLVDLDNVAAGGGGFKIQGENGYDRAGLSVSAAGDVNGDGVDDLIVGASGRYHGSDAGAAYVVLGRAGGFTSPVRLDEVAAGMGGFKVLGENEGDRAGSEVSAAGDVNGDGIDDLIVGAASNGSGGTDAGAAYVIFGRAGFFTDGHDGIDLNDFDLTLHPRIQTTRALSGDDLVVLSRTRNLGLLFDGNAGNDTITGSSHTDRIRGDPGDDSLFGHGGDDTLWGSDDADRLDGNAGADRLDGGNGTDHLRGGVGNDRLSGGDGADILRGDAGRDSLTGGAGDDTFDFFLTDHSQPGAADRITDFAQGDLIDLSRIDAVAGGADNSFVFIGDSRFTAPGQLRAYVSGGSTILQGNTLGNGHTELKIVLLGVSVITEADLVL